MGVSENYAWVNWVHPYGPAINTSANAHSWLTRSNYTRKCRQPLLQMETIHAAMPCASQRAQHAMQLNTPPRSRKMQLPFQHKAARLRTFSRFVANIVSTGADIIAILAQTCNNTTGHQHKGKYPLGCTSGPTSGRTDHRPRVPSPTI